MYEDAISAFEEMNGYKDSIGQIEICQSAIIGHKYAEALAMVESGDLVEAYNQFLALGDYKDSMSKAAGICSEYRAMILDAAVVDDIVFSAHTNRITITPTNRKVWRGEYLKKRTIEYYLSVQMFLRGKGLMTTLEPSTSMSMIRLWNVGHGSIGRFVSG